ncbi:hypothetical protein GPECTOR_55g259 [Gonium pectorale]|uniref:CRAL-TRIO domain-containing protein n=1 Tax=Gonium pectorale TaxID=33097 RepID=A0A150G6F7_GONPE|nr:hypothetical protein GPECTOR_55g259 [Gonium pectorale]|eukprot:KXZ45353.1 hypothetical protein GPECTOR_55g259 [Gonium pectorale]
MWEEHLAWRRREGVDTVLTAFEFPEREEFVKLFPQGLHKVDKQGRPVYVQAMGGVHLGELRRVTTDERMFRFHIHEYEYVRKVVLPLCSRLAGRNIDTTFNIIDTKGLSLGQVTRDALRFFGRIAKADQDHFPEMLGHVAVINAAPVFRAVWGLARPLLDPRTQAKVEVLGHDYAPALLRWLDPACLLECLGGSSEGRLGDQAGPWSEPGAYVGGAGPLQRGRAYACGGRR